MNGQSVRAEQWKCPRGHVLGIVERVKRSNGRGQSYHLSRLMLFRQAIDVDCAAEVDVMAVVEGTALDIRCSVCGAMRPWYMGEDALEGLLERLKTTTANEEKNN